MIGGEAAINRLCFLGLQAEKRKARKTGP